jgi:hypothetical protein
VATGLGGNGALIAAAFAVLDAGGDSGDVGWWPRPRTLPLVLFLLIGGAISDRLPRHHVMVAANALSCVSQAAFAVLVLTGEPRLWQMMLLTALGGTGQAFFGPAAEGMLMSTVSGEQAGRAFALFRMAMQGASDGRRGARRRAGRDRRPGLGARGRRGGVRGGRRAALASSTSATSRRAHRAAACSRSAGRLAGVHRPPLAVVHRRAFSIANAVVGAADAVYGPLVARTASAARALGVGPGRVRRGHGRRRPGHDPLETAPPAVGGQPRRLPPRPPSAALAVPLSDRRLCAVMFVAGRRSRCSGCPG